MFPTEVDNFLTDQECAHMIGLAEAEGLEESVTRKHEGASGEGVKVRDLNGDKRLSIDEVQCKMIACFCEHV